MYSRGRGKEYLPDEKAWSEHERQLNRLDIDHPYTEYRDLMANLPDTGSPLITKHLLSYRYALSIKELYKIFPRNNILVVTAEALTRDKEHVVTTCFEFLDLDPGGARYDIKDQNVKPREQDFALPGSYVETLRRFFAPYNQLLSEVTAVNEYASPAGNERRQAPANRNAQPPVTKVTAR